MACRLKIDLTKPRWPGWFRPLLKRRCQRIGGGQSILHHLSFLWAVGLSTNLAAQVISINNQSASPVISKTSVDYERDIQPLLAEHCYECHGPTQQESNFRLDVRDRALSTADWGRPAIIPGNATESLLIQFVSGEGKVQMPPEGHSPLTAEQVEQLRNWIDAGADWPDTLAGQADQSLRTDHWAFQPLQHCPVPEIGESSLIHSNIDRFIIHKLNEKGLSISSPASRRTLIRRVYLDMLGLLPTPEEVGSFEQDESPTATESLVDRVLASPHYGERWARHWLDVIRFGESTGFEVNQERPNAFHYRDYVIAALNSDKPYNDFIREQIAGDAFGADEATGFLVGGPYDTVKSPDINLTLMQREDELADYVNTTSTTFLALTVGCARCHNHKFDPILQRDYYALQAIFAGVEHGERKLQSRITADYQHRKQNAEQQLKNIEQRLTALLADAVQPEASISTKNENFSSALLPPPDPGLNAEFFEGRLAKFVRFTVQSANQYEPCIDELEIFRTEDGTNVALASTGAVATSSGDYEGNPKHRLEHVNDGRYGNDFSWIARDASNAWVQIELKNPETVHKIVWARDRHGQFQDRLPVRYRIETSLDGVQWEVAARSSQRMPVDLKFLDWEELAASLPSEKIEAIRRFSEALDDARKTLAALDTEIPTAYVGKFKSAATIFRLHRGDPLAPREEVLPDTLSVMGSLQLKAETPEQDRRRVFAEWIANEENPLTARVIVNRVWHYHFGCGLVATTSDFGRNGGVPSHPELLDWLANEFMQQGWSLKWLHRQILLSATYQQSSFPRDEAMAVDAESRLLWRFPPRRLEAEAIRDCMLQVSGKLNLAAGGRGFLLFNVKKETVHHYSPLEAFHADHFRRMIYMTKIRQEQDDVFGVFDCPDGGQTMANRNRSTTALQALNLLNSPFMIELADSLSQRLRQEAGAESADQIQLAWKLIFCRQADSNELVEATEFVDRQGLEAFCRALLNTNEFLYLN